ncbi:conserved exported hypothetical protein [[Clostridium] ultunense Esp]|nr:conserved exported hypothetical protein [[Clostridium] ultunense Esp]
MKGKRWFIGLSSTALVLSFTGCGEDESQLSAIPPKPEVSSCRNWIFDRQDGVWECNDQTSDYHGYYYYGGNWYRNKTQLHQSTEYQNYTTSVKKSSGFGSGSKIFGG